jgi:hypothetical protein
VPFRPSSTLESACRSDRFDLDDYRFERGAGGELDPRAAVTARPG